ncbi:MAG: hypothetical protein H6R17_3026 [Proteobacteria bacterium]|nr:hypothetical protein [Pseudomonadota bacterium]
MGSIPVEEASSTSNAVQQPPQNPPKCGFFIDFLYASVSAETFRGLLKVWPEPSATPV